MSLSIWSSLSLAVRDAGRIASVFADRTKSTDFLTILSVAIQRADNRAEMVSHPTFQESWGMLVDMNFKVGDQLLRRVPKCLGRSSFWHTFRDFEISLVQLAEDGVDRCFPSDHKIRLLAEAHRVRSAFGSIYTL